MPEPAASDENAGPAPDRSGGDDAGAPNKVQDLTSQGRDIEPDAGTE